MEDLLQSQIQDSCRLALPNGLKELMSDISREVLRAQPKNLLKFITDYLSTLLVTRENLYIAAQVCSAVCACDCWPELEDELRLAGVDETLVDDVTEIIQKHIEDGEVNEGNLLMRLISKTSIEENHLPAVLEAIRKAFLRHQRNHTQIYESSSSSGDDQTERAVKHTLGLYRKGGPSFETYNSMAKKIQAAYRAYRVRRESETAKTKKTDQLSKTPSRSESNASSQEGRTSGVKNTEIMEKTKVTFGSIDRSTSDRSLDTCNDENFQSKTDAAPLRELSSTSLAGSYLSLPKYRPYSTHDFDTLEETPEKERSTYDYTRDNLPVDEQMNTNKNIKDNEQKNQNILFELPDEEFSDESIEEIGSLASDDVSTGPEEELLLKGMDVADMIEENIFEHQHLYLEPTTDAQSVLKLDKNMENIEAGTMAKDNMNAFQDEKIQSVPKPDEEDENIEEASIITEENVNALDIIEEVQNYIQPDKIDAIIKEVGNMTEENVNGSVEMVEEVQSLPQLDEWDEKIEVGLMTEDNGNVVGIENVPKPDHVDESIQEDIMSKENVNNLLDKVEDIQSVLKLDEVEDIIEEAGIMSAENVNGSLDEVDEIDEVQENMEEAGITTEEGVNEFPDVVEENIVIVEVGDNMNDDLPEENINGSY